MGVSEILSARCGLATSLLFPARVILAPLALSVTSRQATSGMAILGRHTNRVIGERTSVQ